MAGPDTKKVLKDVCIPLSFGIRDKSENISQMNLGYILGCISNISQIYLGYECIRDASRIYPRCISDISQIDLISRIYLEYIPDLSWKTDSSGIYLFIPHLYGIPRLGGRQIKSH
jgi:hypothetical protein